MAPVIAYLAILPVLVYVIGKVTPGHSALHATDARGVVIKIQEISAQRVANIELSYNVAHSL